MRVLSANVTSGGAKVLGTFFEQLSGSPADIITLQEMRREQIGTWRRRLEAHGYHVLDTFELPGCHGADPDGTFRRDGLLIASRWPMQVLDPQRWGLPWPERVLSAVVDGPGRRFAIYTTHVPNASTGIKLYQKVDKVRGADRLAKKVETFEGILRGLAEEPTLPKVLTGDFNTPRFETADGSVGYWQHSCPGPLKPQLERRWLEAESGVIQGLTRYGMYDVFRRLHGYGAEAFSWENRRGATLSRYRYDHVFASEAFEARACDYLHDLRLSSTHHAGVFAELELV